ncbi:MAG: HdeD family acid-resistance protein [Pseudomonadota bacterium]
MTETPTLPPIPETMKENSGWLLALGIAMVLGGFLAFLGPVAASVAVELMVGIAMLVGGALQAVHAFRAVGWRARVVSALSAALYLGGGILLLLNPLAGLVALTLVALAVMMADGFVRIALGLQLRPDDGWLWLTLSGVLSVVLGIWLFSLFPAVSLMLLGILLGVNFVAEGAAYIAFALAIRRSA